MDEQTILAHLEQRLALELGRQSMLRMRAEVERDLAAQLLAQRDSEAKAPSFDPAPEHPAST